MRERREWKAVDHWVNRRGEGGVGGWDGSGLLLVLLLVLLGLLLEGVWLLLKKAAIEAWKW